MRVMVMTAMVVVMKMGTKSRRLSLAPSAMLLGMCGLLGFDPIK